VSAPDPIRQRRAEQAFVPGVAAVVLLIATMFVPAGHDPIYASLTDEGRVASLFELARVEPMRDDEALLTPEPRYTGLELLAKFLPFGGLGECVILALVAGISAFMLFKRRAKWLFLPAYGLVLAITYVYIAVDRDVAELASVLPGGGRQNPLGAWFSPVVLITATAAAVALLVAAVTGGYLRSEKPPAPDDAF